MPEVLLDAAGHPRSPATVPGFHVQGIDGTETIDTVHARRPPMLPVDQRFTSDHVALPVVPGDSEVKSGARCFRWDRRCGSRSERASIARQRGIGAHER
jgi:hypothetical protein